MVDSTNFLMVYTFLMLSLMIKEIEANEISTFKSLWCILKEENTCYSIIIHLITGN